MAIVKGGTAPVTETEKRKQVVLVPDGLYSGLLAGYSLPKKYKLYQPNDKGETEEWRMYAWFTITHDRTNAPLDRFSSALFKIKCLVMEGEITARPKLFYDAESGFVSGYVAFLHAMTGVPMGELALGNTDYDLDHFIARPAIMFTKQGKPSRETGLVSVKITTLQPPDSGVRKALKPLYDSREVEHQEISGLAYLKSPSPSYEDETTAVSAPASDDFDDQIPF